MQSIMENILGSSTHTSHTVLSDNEYVVCMGASSRKSGRHNVNNQYNLFTTISHEFLSLFFFLHSVWCMWSLIFMCFCITRALVCRRPSTNIFIYIIGKIGSLMPIAFTRISVFCSSIKCRFAAAKHINVLRRSHRKQQKTNICIYYNYF